MDLMSGSGSGDLPVSNETSDDLTCAARSIQEPPAALPYSEYLVLVTKTYLSFAFSSTFIAGSFLNIFLFYLIIRHKKLHTLTFKISLQMVVLDLLQLYGITLFRLVTVITDEWVFGAGMCEVAGYIFQCLTLARTFIMCVFVIDRFLSIFAPYFYPRHSNKIATTLSVIAWVSSVLIPLPMVPGLLDCYRFNSTQCVADALCSRLCSLYNLLYFGFVFIPTTLTPVVLYALLYWKVRKIKRQNFPIGGESQLSRKKDWKTAITFFLLFLASFLLTTGALTLIFIFASILRFYGPSPALYVCLVFSISITTIIGVVDPIVIMRHSDVKEVLREIKTKLCGRCGLGQRQNQDRNWEPDRGTPGPARSVQHMRATTVVQQTVDLEQEQQRVDREQEQQGVDQEQEQLPGVDREQEQQGVDQEQGQLAGVDREQEQQGVEQEQQDQEQEQQGVEQEQQGVDQEQEQQGVDQEREQQGVDQEREQQGVDREQEQQGVDQEQEQEQGQQNAV